MKYIGITQRVHIISDYNERRDSIDQKWNELLFYCGFIPITVPNNIEIVKRLLENICLQGLLLTGGNSLSKYGGEAPERDEVEKYLLNYSIINDIPILGVCRGMQVIQDYFGVNLNKVEGHIMKRQIISFYDEDIEVNSYHNWGTIDTKEYLLITAIHKDGTIKGIKHKEHRIEGIMWHPERITPFSQRDINLIKNFYK